MPPDATYVDEINDLCTRSVGMSDEMKRLMEELRAGIIDRSIDSIPDDGFHPPPID